MELKRTDGTVIGTGDSFSQEMRSKFDIYLGKPFNLSDIIGSLEKVLKE